MLKGGLSIKHILRRKVVAVVVHLQFSEVIGMLSYTGCWGTGDWRLEKLCIWWVFGEGSPFVLGLLL